MKTLLAIAVGGNLLAGLALAAPALAADSCLRPIQINSMKPLDRKTIHIVTHGTKRPNYLIKFRNNCGGMKFGDPLVFGNLYSGSQCISTAENVSVVNGMSGVSTPCIIESITPMSKDAPEPPMQYDPMSGESTRPTGS